MTPSATPLPYTDTKPHGHADFTSPSMRPFASSWRASVWRRLRRYWQQMGADYHRPVSELWRQGGLPAVAAHWRAFFAAEPGAEVEVIAGPEEVRLEVRTCPMIKHLRDHGREIVPCLCQHCYYVSEAMAAPAGLTVRITGGNGACTQRFLRAETNEPGQQLDHIQEGRMTGCYDFCGHYEWTFEWLRQQGGQALVTAYWDEAIHRDAQVHASTLITAQGFEGMKEYWGPTLADEGAVSHRTVTDTVFRIDMHECPSKGFLLRNGLEQYTDYCDHCMGWIGPMMKDAGFVVDHQHNHCGQCWWEMRRVEDATPPSAPGALSGAEDVRLRPGWLRDAPLDTYQRATEPDDKTTA